MKKLFATILAVAGFTVAGNLSGEIVVNERSSFGSFIFDECSLEPVVVEGVSHIAFTPPNQEHGAHYHGNIHGTGVGMVSGEEYVFNRNIQYKIQNKPDGSFTRTDVVKTRLVNKGKGENLTVYFTLELGVDADGNFFFNISNVSTCRGK